VFQVWILLLLHVLQYRRLCSKGSFSYTGAAPPGAVAAIFCSSMQPVSLAPKALWATALHATLAISRLSLRFRPAGVVQSVCSSFRLTRFFIGRSCSLCSATSFANTTGLTACYSCPANAVRGSISTSSTPCLCVRFGHRLRLRLTHPPLQNPGYSGSMAGPCSPCPASTYNSVVGGACTACPAGIPSASGSKSLSECGW
jgi:hypothetical protein